LGLDYNTPARSTQGLKGEYWNLAANTTTVPSTGAQLTRTDPEVNFNFAGGSPGGAVTQNDWFGVRWSGYFVAPKADTYYFGGVNDDWMSVYVNGQQVYSQTCYNNYDGANCMGASGVQLAAGAVVPIVVEYIEGTGSAYARLATKTLNGSIAEQLIPKDWLRTAPKLSTQNTGLVGRYYTDDGTHTFPANDADPFRFILSRTDSNMHFEWGGGGVFTGSRTDQFMARWRGIVTVPATGIYTFGATADDGVRVKVAQTTGGAETTALDAWADHSGTYWPGTGATGTSVSLDANKAYAITIEYYENNTTATMIH
jgi:hypothetical protein